MCSLFLRRGKIELSAGLPLVTEKLISFVGVGERIAFVSLDGRYCSA
jgi:hypothetical protein